MWSIYEIIHMCTAVQGRRKWRMIIAVNFQLKRLERRSLKKIRASTGFQSRWSPVFFIFFRLLLSNCWLEIYCDDYSSISIHSLVDSWYLTNKTNSLIPLKRKNTQGYNYAFWAAILQRRSSFVMKVWSGYPGLSDHMGTFSSRDSSVTRRAGPPSNMNEFKF